MRVEKLLQKKLEKKLWKSELHTHEKEPCELEEEGFGSF